MENGEEKAFPSLFEFETSKGTTTEYHTGLTKREYFAGLAMKGLSANPDYTNHQLMITKYAIELADELLKQLEQ